MSRFGKVIAAFGVAVVGFNLSVGAWAAAGYAAVITVLYSLLDWSLKRTAAALDRELELQASIVELTRPVVVDLRTRTTPVASTELTRRVEAARERARLDADPTDAELAAAKDAIEVAFLPFGGEHR